MKKLVILLITSILCSCSITGDTVYFYTGGNEFYPVVIKVFENHNIYPNKIDIVNNEFTSDYIYQSNLGARVRYKTKVKFKNNAITVKLYNIQQFSFDVDTWLNEDRFLYFDETALPKKIADEINAILNNQKIYDQVKKEVYNNFLFHYLVIKDLSKSQTDRWVKNHMLGRRYDLNVTLSKFEINKTGKLPNMKYVAEFTNTGISNFNDLFVFNYFTNSDKYSGISNKTQLKITGKLLESIDIADLLINSSHVFLVDG
ncbi:MAG: hypothetical protein ACC657_07610 [Thiohalomonadales bacterium]